MPDFTNIYEGTLINADEVEAARAAGLLIHHEMEYQTHITSEDGTTESWEEITRDDWFAAAPEWVNNYYSSGGTWGYA